MASLVPPAPSLASAGASLAAAGSLLAPKGALLASPVASAEPQALALAEGLSAARLAALAPARQALVDVLALRDGAALQRSLNAQARVRTHNTLNDEITTLQGKAQRTLRPTDPARYDDYVRHAAPGQGDGPLGSPPPTPPV